MRRLGRFSEQDLDEIQRAVSSAEELSSGEIVTYIVGESDAYPEVSWSAAAIGGLVGLLIASLLAPRSVGWGAPGLEWTLLPPMLSALFAVILAQFDAVKRLLLRRESVDHRVLLRAEAAFLEEEAFATRSRTGILIFLSLLEHRAVLLADRGIEAVVEAGAWQEIVDELVAGLRQGERSAPLLRAIGRCGDLLVEHGLALEKDDTDELPNRPRLRQR